jgi:mono/diheme cytochrome c family protein
VIQARFCVSATIRTNAGMFKTGNVCKGIVMRNAVILSAVGFLSASAASGQDPVLAGNSAMGKIYYQRACADCHVSVLQLRPAVTRLNSLDQVKWLDTFLTGHRAPNPEMRRDLIAYLISGSNPDSEPLR